MITMFNAFTEEVDDVAAAIEEIRSQLDISHFKKNSLGILHCYPDFVETGVVKGLSELLDFPVVGCSTSSQGMARVNASLVLTLSVLTSDDVNFAAGVSEPVDDDMPQAVADLYHRLFAEPPRMLLTFVPFMLTLGGDEFVEQLDQLSGGIPAFGTQPISDEPDFSNCFTFYNGESYVSSLVLVGLYGAVDPIFLQTSIYAENILKPRAVVTGAHKNILSSLNDMSTQAYLESVGLIQKNSMSSLVSTPFVIDLADGSRLIRTCLTGDGQGGAILCGHVPVGARLGFAIMESDDIIKSTGEVTQEAVGKAQGRVMLMYSCAARVWSLGGNNRAEVAKVQEIIGDAVPYYFACSGGEVSPQWLENGQVTNHLQNDSLVICVL